jgi:hypothetical protein
MDWDNPRPLRHDHLRREIDDATLVLLGSVLSSPQFL